VLSTKFVAPQGSLLDINNVHLMVCVSSMLSDVQYRNSTNFRLPHAAENSLFSVTFSRYENFAKNKANFRWVWSESHLTGSRCLTRVGFCGPITSKGRKAVIAGGDGSGQS
jgi:hypothetical protein